MKEPIANSSHPPATTARASAPPTNAPPHVITKRAIAGWVLYDLANTIFSMGVVTLYFPLWIMLFVITFAIAGGFAWGWLTDRWEPKRTLSVVLKAWMGIFLFAAIVGLFGLPLWAMYLMSACAGFSLGGVWAADRPYMLRLTPPSRIGEFYGLYGMVGRFSAVTGPVIWWLVFDLCTRQFKMTELASEGVAVLALMILVLISYIILRPVSDQTCDWSAVDVQGATKPETSPPEPQAKSGQ